MGSRIWLCVIVALEAFYLPGMAPVSYCEQNDELNQCFSTIQIFVNRSGDEQFAKKNDFFVVSEIFETHDKLFIPLNRLTSTDSAIPFEYNSFDFCKGIFPKIYKIVSALVKPIGLTLGLCFPAFPTAILQQFFEDV